MTLRSKAQTTPGGAMLARGTMQQGYREMLSPHVIFLTLAAASILASGFALVGPIGFYEIVNPLARVAHSLLYMALGFPLFFGLVVLVFYFMRFRSPLELLAGLALATLFQSFQCTAVIYTIEKLTHPGVPAGVGFLEIFFKITSTSLIGVLLLYYVVSQRMRHAGLAGNRAAPGRGIAAAGLEASETAARPDGKSAAGKPRTAAPAGAATAPAEERPAAARVPPVGEPPVRGLPGVVGPAPAAPVTLQPSAAGFPPSRGILFKLLPGRLGTDLVFIKSEDHYLEVHTTVGSSLIKMRFSDAVAELGERGMQVHRSYWVATGHVLRTARNGKRTTLRLTGDQEVPVSVTHLRAVRALLDR
jgi:hypothetical protein